MDNIIDNSRNETIPNYMEEINIRESERVRPNYIEWLKQNPDPDPLVENFLNWHPEMLNTGIANADLWTSLSEDLKARPGGSTDYKADFENQSLFELIKSKVGLQIANVAKLFAVEKMGYDESAFDIKDFDIELFDEPVSPVKEEPQVVSHASESELFREALKKRDSDQVLPSYLAWKQENPDAHPLVASYLDANPQMLYTDSSTSSQWTALSEDLKNRPGGAKDFNADFFEPSLESLITKYVGKDISTSVKSFAVNEAGYDESAFSPREMDWGDLFQAETAPATPALTEAQKDDALFNLVDSGIINIPEIDPLVAQQNVLQEAYEADRANEDRNILLKEYELWSDEIANQNVDYLVTRFLDANPESIRIEGSTAYNGASPSEWGELARGLADIEGGSRKYEPNMIHPSLESYIEAYVGPEGAARLKEFAINELGYEEADFEDKFDIDEPEKRSSKHQSASMSL